MEEPRAVRTRIAHRRLRIKQLPDLHISVCIHLSDCQLDADLQPSSCF